MGYPNFKKIKQDVLILLGKECKEYRERVLKMTQKEFAEEKNVEQSAVSFFENGHADSLFMYMLYFNRGLKSDDNNNK